MLTIKARVLLLIFAMVVGSVFVPNFIFSPQTAYAATAPSSSTYKKLRRAARKNNIEKLEKYFLKYPNLDLNRADKKGVSALQHASAKGSKEAVLWLLAKGANPDTKNSSGYTGLMYLTGTSWKKESYSRLDLVKAYQAAGADITAKTYNGETALMYASRNQLNSIVEFLLQSGADINAQNDNNLTPLLFMVEQAGKIKRNPLQVNLLDTVKLLIDSGADIHVKDQKYRSALHLVAVRKNVGNKSAIIKYLVSEGADINYISKKGFNLRDLLQLETKYGLDIELKEFFDQSGVKHTDAYREEMEVRAAAKAARELKFRQQQAIRNPNLPLPCGATTYLGMTELQGEAVKYLIERKTIDRDFCIESITAKQKIPLRGNTVIKYRAKFHYVRGYKTECLPQNLRKQVDRNEKIILGDDRVNISVNLDCLGVSPVKIGGRRYKEGAVEI